MQRNKSKYSLKNDREKKFTLKILWLNQKIAFSVDHIVKHGHSPLTSYFFWPCNDAWSQIKSELDSKPWISKNDTVHILNTVTSIINYWQENKEKKSIIEAKAEFPELIFYGSQ